MRLPCILISLLCFLGMRAAPYTVVADSVTHTPLPRASVFDKQGIAIGITATNGRLPYIEPTSFPLTIRYIGYGEARVPHPTADTIFLAPIIDELPEVLVESTHKKVIHMLAYVREYSTMTTYTDTVFMFRRKMVDFMVNPDKKSKYKGWTRPRVLASQSYYRFTDKYGLDSVSDASRHHFSWSDWIGLNGAFLPESLAGGTAVADTVHGKYSPAEIWNRSGERVGVDINVLADSIGRRWVPDLSGFFRNELDFESFHLRYNYDNVFGRTADVSDLTGYSFNIQSNGRGHDMFFFNGHDDPYFVSTYAEVYITDKEYIPLKEARQWEKHNFSEDKLTVFEPDYAAPLQPSILALIDRVNSIDHGALRLNETPDWRLIGQHLDNNNFNLGNRILNVIKTVTGISSVRHRRHMNKQWREQRSEMRERYNRPTQNTSRK